MHFSGFQEGQNPKSLSPAATMVSPAGVTNVSINLPFSHTSGLERMNDHKDIYILIKKLKSTQGWSQNVNQPSTIKCIKNVKYKSTANDNTHHQRDK